jgi:hypothetical protein
MALGALDDLGWTHLKFSAKDTIPKAARNTKSVLVVGKVVLEVVLLELLVVWGQSVVVSDAFLEDTFTQLTSGGAESSGSCRSTCTRKCRRSKQPTQQTSSRK